MDFLLSGCTQLGLDLSAEQRIRLLAHVELLAKWNKRLNLTAIGSGDDMIRYHILDSLAVYRYIKGEQLLDIGSGGGFPGLPLAVVCPNLAVTLLDSRGRRIEFLRYVIAEIGLKNVSVVKSRIEAYRPANKFDTLTARAFSSLSDLIRISKESLTPGARLLAFKGKFPAQEIATLNDELPALVSQIAVKKLEVPFLNAHRHLIIIDF